MIENVMVYLDPCGKYSLVFAFFILQLATIVTYCMHYHLYYTNVCNPRLYQLTEPFKAVGMKIEYGTILFLSLLIGIAFKFASVICVWMALEDYENLEANGFLFVLAQVFSLLPANMLAPLLTYDHENCIPANFAVS